MGIAEEALQYIKHHKCELLEHFANDNICLPEKNPFSFFMAGSAGAGKTEFSRNFLLKTSFKAIRIDADEIRDFTPHYKKTDSAEIQRAAALGVEYLHDHALLSKKSFILDGTFADYEKSHLNIERSLRKNRIVHIYYLYQDPLIAWKFTKAREATEGRPVPKDIFIRSFFNSYTNVEKIKLEYGSKIHLIVVKKNFEKSQESLFIDVDRISPYATI